jgi:hypothetical protein
LFRFDIAYIDSQEIFMRLAVFSMRVVQRLLTGTLCMCLLFTAAALSQSSSGTITGRVLDTSGQSVPNAKVVLTRSDTRELSNFSMSVTGDFVFTGLQPGPYSIKVEASGFKTLETTDLELAASDRLSAGDLTLQVGTVTEVVKVTSEATPIQTTSSERSALIDSNQVTNLTTRGRDVFGRIRDTAAFPSSTSVATRATIRCRYPRSAGSLTAFSMASYIRGLKLWPIQTGTKGMS